MQSKGHITEDKFAELEMPVICLQIIYNETTAHGIEYWGDVELKPSARLTLRPHYRNKIKFEKTFFLGKEAIGTPTGGLVKPEDALPGVDIDAFFSACDEITETFPGNARFRYTGDFTNKLKALIPDVEGVYIVYVSRNLSTAHIELTQLWESIPKEEELNLRLEAYRFASNTHEEARKIKEKKKEKEKREREDDDDVKGQVEKKRHI